MKRDKQDVDDDDEMRDEIVPPGGVVSCPMFFMDTMSAREAFAATTDAVKDHRPHHATPLNDAAQQRRVEARDAYIERAVNAWRTPHATDAAQPDLGSRPGELRQHLRTESGDDAQARRDLAYQGYVNQLGSAWRTNPRAAAIERQREQWTAER